MTMQKGVPSEVRQPVGLAASKSDTENRAERLRQAIKEAGGNREVARRSQVPTSTIDGYLAGGGMKLDPVVQLADATGVSLEWLATGRGPMRGGLEPMVQVQSSSGPPPGYVSIPRYEVRAGAGRGVIAPSERVIEQMTVSADYIRRVFRRNPEDMALLEALGDSMAPTIRSGDVLMVDVSVRDLRAGSVYVLLLGEDLMVKRLHRRASGAILIISDNTLYPQDEVTPSEGNPLQIVGEVVGLVGPLRS